MTQEEIEWYEENWCRGRTRFNTDRAKATDSRSYKLGVNLWDLPYDGGSNPCYYMDINCWKSQRKTHYRIPKVKKEKKRKKPHKEHWRFKKPYHSYGWKNLRWRVERRKNRAEKALKEKMLLERIAELKKTCEWVICGFYKRAYSEHKGKLYTYTIDVDNPFFFNESIWK